MIGRRSSACVKHELGLCFSCISQKRVGKQKMRLKDFCDVESGCEFVPIISSLQLQIHQTYAKISTMQSIERLIGEVQHNYFDSVRKIDCAMRDAQFTKAQLINYVRYVEMCLFSGF